MTQVFYAHGLVTPNANITQLRAPAASYAIQQLVQMSSGDYAPSYAGGITSAPALPFSTSDIRTALTLFDSDEAHTKGRNVSYDGSAGNTDLLYRMGEAYGVREDLATATHEQLRYTKAFLVWDTITATQGGVAEMACRLFATHDGTNKPLTQTQAAITLNPAIASLFTLGPISINGTAYDGLQRMTWSNNLALELIADSGNPFVSYAAVRAYSPTIRAVVRNAALHRTITNTGLAITAYAQYLRQLEDADITYDDNESKHIKFTATNGTVYATRLDAAGLVELSVVLTRPNSTTDPFAMAYDQAIT